MAIYYLRMRTFGRSRGKSGSRATSAAAYRSGERIRDERTGRVYDFRRRADVMRKEIVLPAQLAAERASLSWARDRTTLWNAAEHAELRRDSRVAREFVVALPHELAPEARSQLAMRFAQDIADRYRSAVDVAIHAPRGDARNFHAHLLATTREITPDGLGPKTTLELSGRRRHELGLARWREEIGSLREHWAHLTNAALARANVPTRVTHLSRAERGLAASEASPRVPIAAYHMELRGERSFIAEKIRERHRADLQRAQAAAPTRVLERGAPERREPGLPRGERSLGAIGRSMFREMGAGVRAAWRGLQGRFTSHLPSAEPASRSFDSKASSSGELRAAAIERGGQLDERMRKSAHDWLAYREKQRTRVAAEREAGLERASEPTLEREHARSRDHGFSL